MTQLPSSSTLPDYSLDELPHHGVKPVMWGWATHDPFMPGPPSYEVANSTMAKQVLAQNRAVAAKLWQKEALIDSERKIFLEKSSNSKKQFLAKSIFKRGSTRSRSSQADLERSRSGLIGSRHRLDATSPGKSISHMSTKSCMNQADQDYSESMWHLTDQAIQLLQQNTVEYDLDDPHIRDEYGRVRLDIPDSREDLHLVFTQEKVVLPDKLAQAIEKGRLHLQVYPEDLFTPKNMSKPAIIQTRFNPKMDKLESIQHYKELEKRSSYMDESAVDMVAKANSVRFPPAPRRGSWVESSGKPAPFKIEKRRSSSFQHVKLPHVNKTPTV